jgi:iron complex outermembrane receptor protein
MKTNITTPCLALSIALLAAANVQAQKSENNRFDNEDSEVVQLGAFEVTAARDDDYRPETVISATRFETLARDLPLTVDVLTSRMLADHAITDLMDALDTIVSGINESSVPRQAVIRGMASDYALRNGIPVTNIFKTAPIERVEVVRGAAGVLYGTTEPGGVRNMISKRPTARPYFDARAMWNSFGRKTYEFDARGPLIPGGKLSYRLGGIYGTYAETYDWRWRTDRFIYPAVQWRPTGRTTIFLECDYQAYKADNSGRFPVVRRNGQNHNIPATPNNLGYALPYGFNLSGPSPSNLQLTRLTNLIIDQKISDHWDFRAMYSWQLYDHVYDQYNQQGYMRPGDTSYRVTAAAYSNRWRQEFARADLLGRFAGRRFVDRLLLGVDYTWRLTADDKQWRDAAVQPNGNWAVRTRTITIGAVDAEGGLHYDSATYGNPTYENGLLYDFTGFRDWAPLFRHTKGWDLATGVYAVNQLSFNQSRTHVLGGLRHDWLRSQSKTPWDQYMAGPDTMETSESSRLSPQIGVSHRLTTGISTYANYSTSVYPNAQRNPDGATLKAQYGEGYDIGLKFELFKRKLAGGLGYYLIYKKNLPILDPAGDTDPAREDYYILVGKAGSQGAELSINYSPVRNANIMAAYTYVDSKDRETGTPLVRSTKHNGNFWARYTFARTFLKGLSVGAGYRYRSKIYIGTAGNRPYPWRPSSTLVDAMLSYPVRIGRARLLFQLNGKNLLNQAHIDDGPDGHPYDTGRSAVFSVSYRY